jgi:NAD(P)-dependent dehydrogenase (short-subunit alcohol dehydrogenase family)
MLSSTSTAEDVVAGLDLTGRTVVLTGASGGLGLETARALATAGATLVLPVRDPDSMRESEGYRVLHAETGRIDLIPMDLGSLESVRRAATAIGAGYPRVDTLINNAGVMCTPAMTTADGFEFQFGVNHLGHFLLTTRLLPNLVAAGPDARVVTVTSNAYRHAGRIDVADLNFDTRSYDPLDSYGQSKAANVLMTVELARRHGADGITALAVHPGTIITTGLSRHMDRETIKKLMSLAGDTFDPANLKTEAQGAATTVWAATEPSLRAHNGSVLEDCQLAEITPDAADPILAQQLWELSESWVTDGRR